MTLPLAPAELLVDLDRASSVPLPVQLATALRAAIDDARLRPGEGVPPSRAIAQRLGVARGVVVAAYEQLTAEGYLSASRGRGTFVSPDLPITRPARRLRASGKTAIAPETHAPRPPLAPGGPRSAATANPAWRAAWRDASVQATSAAPLLGDSLLRQEITEHLRLVRGTTRDASEVVVTAGVREGLSLLMTALGASRGGGRSLMVGVEDPGYPSLRSAVARLGAQIVSLPVDDDGLRTEALPAHGLDLVIVTPSHQYPSGGSLPLTRRRELLAWARSSGAIIVEDDYDSELRHTGAPLPALAAIDDVGSGAVVTLGTFSGTVSPALMAGFLLAPDWLLPHITAVRRDLGSPVPAVAQRALAKYLQSGELRRNIARLRRRLVARRDLLAKELGAIPGVHVRPAGGGLHAVIELGTIERERAITERAHQTSARFPNGLGTAALGTYWQHHRGGRAAGLVLGLGSAGDGEFAAAIAELAGLLAPGFRT